MRLLLACLALALASPWAVKRPKLVVVMVIDQFRADYLSRFQSQFLKDGFLALIHNGAYFPNGEYGLLQAMTCPGHATILTGAYPYQMGIPLNDWFDQKTGKMNYCVIDKDGTLSPKNLVGSTVGDELKNADWPSKIVALAVKDRAAILLGGHRADLAFWWAKGKWETSAYYRRPSWIEKLNQTAKPCELEKTCGVDLTVDAAKAAIDGEKLGQSQRTDILAVSFSSFDFAGHLFGPNSEEMRLMTLAQDKAVAEIRAHLARRGIKDVVFVLTGDHGVAPTPEYLNKAGVEAGRIDEKSLVNELNGILSKKFGKGASIAGWEDFNFFINEGEARAAKLDLAAIENEIKQHLVQNPGFARVFTRAEYDAGNLPPGDFKRRINRTYFPGRSGNVIAIPKPYYLPGKKVANHLTGYSYDRTVPIVFSGFGVKNGLYAGGDVIDIAPTLAFLLGVLPPAQSEGKVLKEALKGVN